MEGWKQKYQVLFAGENNILIKERKWNLYDTHREINLLNTIRVTNLLMALKLENHALKQITEKKGTKNLGTCVTFVNYVKTCYRLCRCRDSGYFNM